MSLVLSAEQERARTAVLSWYRNPNKTNQWFFLDGPAGTGKSTIIAATIESIKGKIFFAAPTAKAALVMRKKGCDGAQTIHSLIYRPQGIGGNRKRIEELQTALTRTDIEPAQIKTIQVELKKLMEGVKPIFSLNLDSLLRGANLLVVDEISMVPNYVMKDLLSFGVPILVQGDLAQLPPVGDSNFFKDIKPDFSLTEVHRQALDSPVIQLATLVRNRRPLSVGRYGDSLVTRDKEDIDGLAFDQIIVGRHVTRNATNRKIRTLLGYEGDLPYIGERLICKRNEPKFGLINGDQFTVTEFEDISKNTCIIGVTNSELTTRVVAHKEYFYGKEPSKWDIPKASCFIYGYSATCHSVQGDQFDSVYVYDEASRFPDPYKWRYTAISRAAKNVSVLI